MGKRCPHCDGEIMPSVIKCVHCGRNVKDPPDGAAAGVEPGVAFTPPIASSEPEAPPPSFAFTPAAAADAAAAPTAAAPPAAEPETSAAAEDGVTQDWGPPIAPPSGVDQYWALRDAPTSPGGPTGLPTAGGPKETITTIAVAMIALAGIVAALSSLQPWVTVGTHGIKGVPDVDDSVKGIVGWEGKATLALGVILLVLVVGWFTRHERGPLKAALAAGLGLAGIAGYTIGTLNSEFSSGFVEAARVQGMPEEQARGLVKGWLGSGALSIKAEIWMTAVIVAGIVAAVAGLMVLVSKGSPAPPLGDQWSPPAPNAARG